MAESIIRVFRLDRQMAPSSFVPIQLMERIGSRSVGREKGFKRQF